MPKGANSYQLKRNERCRLTTEVNYFPFWVFFLNVYNMWNKGFKAHISMFLYRRNTTASLYFFRNSRPKVTTHLWRNSKRRWHRRLGKTSLTKWPTVSNIFLFLCHKELTLISMCWILEISPKFKNKVYIQ